MAFWGLVAGDRRESERNRMRGLPGAAAHERRRAGALSRALHGDGEVAAAELGQDGVARGGKLQRAGEWVHGSRG